MAAKVKRSQSRTSEHNETGRTRANAERRMKPAGSLGASVPPAELPEEPKPKGGLGGTTPRRPQTK